MAHIGTRVRHFSTCEQGVVVQVKDDMCLVEYQGQGHVSRTMYRQDEIGYVENANTFLYYVNDDGTDKTEG